MRSTQITIFVLGLSFFCSFTKSDRPLLNYIDRYSGIAVSEMHRTGIPASITLAQGIIESGFGTSQLSLKSNNHFGIKCNNNWQGGGFYYKDDDYKNGKLIKSCFRTYNSPEESYYDHSEFLVVNSRYHFLFDLDSKDYKAWAKGLKKAGYATAKDYATKLIKMIEKYQLYKYDRLPNNKPLVQGVLIAPKAELIPVNRPAITSKKQHLKFAELTAPAATFIPDNYKIGDGFRRKNLSTKISSNFHRDVYGKHNASRKYLDEITPQLIVDKK